MKARTGLSLVMSRLLLAALILALLMAVMQVHGAGQTLLATTLLLIGALALWTYTSRRSQASRYLFPGVAAAIVFVIFPMLYTVGLGFTNSSSRNLLEQDAARRSLLAESIPAAGTRHAFSLHADLNPGAEQTLWRLRLIAPNGRVLGSDPVRLDGLAADGSAQPQVIALQEGAVGTFGAAQALSEVVERLAWLRVLQLRTPEGTLLSLTGLRDFTQQQPLYRAGPDNSLVDTLDAVVYRPDGNTGFFTSAEGAQLQPGYRVNVGLRHYAAVFGEARFREPFVGVFVWTVAFAALSVLLSAALGLLLAELLSWEALPFKGLYRVVLFLPYAVPGFISILVFKGLFNQNLGEINLILHNLFGIRPAWFSDPVLARTMLLIVNVWLGFPYMMVLCTGLIKSIPGDLAEASALLGAGPWAHFRRVTLPLILKPLTPLLISAFAFNFNNFVLISLLTGGRPDHLDSTLPAGMTDILVSYTWRIAFQDSGQQFGLAAAISTIIFLLVAAITLVQMRVTQRQEKL